MGFMFIVILVLNFVISWFNAWSTGRAWAEANAAGGWVKLMAWSGAVMAAVGFTWTYTTLLALGAGAAGYLSPRYVELAMELGYAVIILPALGSGLAITVQSVMSAWRRRTFGSVGVAGWNTFAQIHNTYQAASLLPNVLTDLSDGLGGKKDDRDDASARLVIILVVAALLGGVITTAMIIRSSARAVAGSRLAEARAARH